jgi:hypothetical protein
MSEQPVELTHDPAPPEPRRIIPERPLLSRGVALGALAVGAGWLGVSALQKSAFLAPVTLVAACVSALAAWASIIHLTGGEKFDDHPFI